MQNNYNTNFETSLAIALAENNHDSFPAQAWKLNAHKNLPEVLKEMKEQALDNYVLVLDIVGEYAMWVFDQIHPEVSMQYRARILTYQIDLC